MFLSPHHAALDLEEPTNDVPHPEQPASTYTYGHYSAPQNASPRTSGNLLCGKRNPQTHPVIATTSDASDGHQNHMVAAPLQSAVSQGQSSTCSSTMSEGSGGQTSGHLSQPPAPSLLASAPAMDLRAAYRREKTMRNAKSLQRVQNAKSILWLPRIGWKIRSGSGNGEITTVTARREPEPHEKWLLAMCPTMGAEPGTAMAAASAMSFEVEWDDPNNANSWENSSTVVQMRRNYLAYVKWPLSVSYGRAVSQW